MKKFILFFLICAFSYNVLAKNVKENKHLVVTVVTDNACKFCSTDKTEESIKYYTPDLKFNAIDYRSKAGKDLISKYNVQTLPFFLFPNDIQQDPGYNQLSKMLVTSGSDFSLKPEAAGIFMFLTRPYIHDQIDYFFDFFDSRTADTFPVVIDFCARSKAKLNINIIVPNKPVFGYPQQEIVSALAVRKIYPDMFLEYLTERIKFISTIDCTTSITKMGMDYKQILSQLEPNTAGKLLKDNETLIKDLGITNGNAMLFNNQKLFMIFQAKKEDFAKVFNKK